MTVPRPRRRGGEVRLPPPVPEWPAILRAFHPAAWGASVDNPEDVIREARDRWQDARFEWGGAHGLSPLDVTRAGINDRRRADGAAPIDYGD